MDLKISVGSYLIIYISIITIITISVILFLYYVISKKKWDDFKNNLIFTLITYVCTIMSSLITYIFITILSKNKYIKNKELSDKISSIILETSNRLKMDLILSTKKNQVKILQDELKVLRTKMNEFIKDKAELEKINKKYKKDLLDDNYNLSDEKINEYNKMIEKDISKITNEEMKDFYKNLQEILLKIKDIMTHEKNITEINNKIISNSSSEFFDKKSTIVYAKDAEAQAKAAEAAEDTEDTEGD